MGYTREQLFCLGKLNSIELEDIWQKFSEKSQILIISLGIYKNELLRPKINIDITSHVDLHTTNHAYKKTKTCPLKVLKGVLNKITEKNFDKLKKEIIYTSHELSENDEEISVIFYEKMIQEYQYIDLYLDIYSELSNSLDLYLDIFSGLSKSLLLKKLIDKIQITFQTPYQKNDDFDEEMKFKRRILGNIKLLGKLFLLGKISERILDRCVVTLLNQNTEISIELFCCLIKTIRSTVSVEKYMNFEKFPSKRIQFMIEELKN